MRRRWFIVEPIFWTLWLYLFLATPHNFANGSHLVALNRLRATGTSGLKCWSFSVAQNCDLDLIPDTVSHIFYQVWKLSLVIQVGGSMGLWLGLSVIHGLQLLTRVLPPCCQTALQSLRSLIKWWMSSWRIIIRSNWKILLCCFCHVHFDEDIYIHCIGNILITRRCWQLMFFFRKELLRSQCPTSSCQCRMAMLVYTFNWLPIILTFRYQNLQHKHWFPSRSQFPIQTFVQ